MNKRWPHKRSKHAGKKRVKRDTPPLGVETVQFYREEENVMKRFWDLLKESTIGQISLALLWGGVTAYLLVTGQPVPGEVWGINGAIIGFFFGTKVRQINRR